MIVLSIDKLAQNSLSIDFLFLLIKLRKQSEGVFDNSLKISCFNVRRNVFSFMACIIQKCYNVKHSKLMWIKGY